MIYAETLDSRKESARRAFFNSLAKKIWERPDFLPLLGERLRQCLRGHIAEVVSVGWTEHPDHSTCGESGVILVLTPAAADAGAIERLLRIERRLAQAVAVTLDKMVASMPGRMIEALKAPIEGSEDFELVLLPTPPSETQKRIQRGIEGI